MNKNNININPYIFGYIVLLIVIVLLLFYKHKDKENHVSYQKVLINEIDSLTVENKRIDSLYKDILKKVAIIKSQKDVIQIKEDLKKLKELIEELEKVQGEVLIPSKNSTELINYFENEIK